MNFCSTYHFRPPSEMDFSIENCNSILLPLNIEPKSPERVSMFSAILLTYWNEVREVSILLIVYYKNKTYKKIC